MSRSMFGNAMMDVNEIAKVAVTLTEIFKKPSTLPDAYLQSFVSILF